MALGTLLCLLGVKCAPPPPCVRAFPMRACPFQYVRALASFEPLEAHICSLGAHICSLGAHLCPLGLNCGPWNTFMPSRDQVCTPPFECTPPPMRACPILCVHAPASFESLMPHICPLGAHLCPLVFNYGTWDTFMPPTGQVVPPLCVRAPSYACTSPPPMRVHLPLCVCAFLPGMCAPSQA